MSRFKEVSEHQVYQELLKIKTDEELHEMPDEMLIELILYVLHKVRKNPMKKEVKLIYI